MMSETLVGFVGKRILVRCLERPEDHPSALLSETSRPIETVDVYEASANKENFRIKRDATVMPQWIGLRDYTNWVFVDEIGLISEEKTPRKKSS